MVNSVYDEIGDLFNDAREALDRQGYVPSAGLPDSTGRAADHGNTADGRGDERADDSMARPASARTGYADDYADGLRLDVYSSDELCSLRFRRKEFLVNTLLTPGLTVLAGSPKVGKSWLVLSLCLSVAKGEPFLGMNTKRGEVLYIALEDDRQRLQYRLLSLSDEQPGELYLATSCLPLSDRLCDQLRLFVTEHPCARLIVLDTFQKVRERVREMSYANDYSEVSRLKEIADELGVCVLLVHHTRKQGDSDFMNEISGTNGIAGSADTLMVLKKEKRTSRTATLLCTGRDIEDREMSLQMNSESCLWEKRSDNLSESDGGKDAMPEELGELISMMQEIGKFSGTNSEFAALLADKQGYIITASQLKRRMNQYRYELEDCGVSFSSYRYRDARKLIIAYSASSDKRLRDGV